MNLLSCYSVYNSIYWCYIATSFVNIQNYNQVTAFTKQLSIYLNSSLYAMQKALAMHGTIFIKLMFISISDCIPILIPWSKLMHYTIWQNQHHIDTLEWKSHDHQYHPLLYKEAAQCKFQLECQLVVLHNICTKCSWW